MTMKLYVGNLPYSTTSPDLERLFTPYGAVSSAQVIEDRLTGKSKGFGFVEMTASEDGQKAIAALNGKQFEGRTLTVNVRPSNCLPLSAAMAFWPSSFVDISTKPKPLLLPVSRSSITCALLTAP